MTRDTCPGPDPRVLQAVQLALSGQVDAARERFGEPWNSLLHFNLAASHERLSQLDETSPHAQLALRTQHALQTSPLSDMTRAAIERICSKLGVQSC